MLFKEVCSKFDAGGVSIELLRIGVRLVIRHDHGPSETLPNISVKLFATVSAGVTTDVISIL